MASIISQNTRARGSNQDIASKSVCVHIAEDFEDRPRV